jgi:hypothetical protein
VADLGRSMNVGEIAINTAPPPGGVLVCVLHPLRERTQKLPAGVLPPSPWSPHTDPENRIIYVDSDFLRLLAMRIALFSDRRWGGAGLSASAAVAETILNPPPSQVELWGPNSPAFSVPVQRATWRGAVGFVIAHEVGHVKLGSPPAPDQDTALQGRKRELAPLCPSLTSPAVLALRKYEENADALGFEAVVVGGSAMGRGPKGVAGDLGIVALLDFLLAEDNVRVGSVVQDPFVRGLLSEKIGKEYLARLITLNSSNQVGTTSLVERFYSDTHPASVERLVTLRNKLSKLPESIWYGEPDVNSLQQMELLRNKACAEVGLPATAK